MAIQKYIAAQMFATDDGTSGLDAEDTEPVPEYPSYESDSTGFFAWVCVVRGRGREREGEGGKERERESVCVCVFVCVRVCVWACMCCVCVSIIEGMSAWYTHATHTHSSSMLEFCRIQFVTQSYDSLSSWLIHTCIWLIDSVTHSYDALSSWLIHMKHNR